MWQWFLTILSWVHLQLVEPIVRWWEEVVLGSWEEWLLALVRQGFEETTRFLNGIATWFLQLFSQHSYRDQLRRAWQENNWQQWWGEAATRPSTLNALVANLVAQQQQQAMETDSGRAGSVPAVPALKPVNNGVHATLGVTPVRGRPGVAGTGVGGPQCAHVSTAAAPGQTNTTNGSSTWWPRPQQRAVSGRAQARGGGVSIAARLERPVMFVQQSGMGILDELAKRRHGLIEDAKMAAQLAVSRAFELARSTVRTVLLLPPREVMAAQAGLLRADAAMAAPDGPAAAAESGDGGGGTRGKYGAAVDGGGGTPSSISSAGMKGGGGAGHHRFQLQRSKSAHVNIAELAYQPGAGAGAASTSMSRRGLRRSHSYGRLYNTAASYHQATEAPSDALSVIRAAGYPHELHAVTTADGYVLRLERIPRPGARDVAFFMHGVLDTSMAWVSGGVTGSQAFAAWEAGMDVWLGNSRGNAPRQHQDPAFRGQRYWRYNINHMGMYDTAAQLDHIHNIKCAELGAGTVTLDLDHLGPLAGSFFGGGVRATAGAGGGAGPGGSQAAGGLLPGRAFSALEAVPGQQGQRPGIRSNTKMRQSNSDGNLCRWGSSASTASSGAASGQALQRTPGAYDRTAGLGAGASRAAPSHVPSASSASLGRALSSHGLLTPMESCDGSIESGAGGGEGEAAAGSGGESGAEQEHEGRFEEAGGAPGPSVPSSPLRTLAPPSPSVRRNAVTLTVRSPHADSASLCAEGCPHLEAVVGPGASPAQRHGLAAPTTTFTLDAKTRSDFGPGPGDLPVLTTVGPAAGAGAGTGAAAPSAVASSMLDAVSSVLGPAADAVTLAMASAGAAFASVAASATHLLHPVAAASPPLQRSGPASGPTAAVAGPTAANSPFAAVSAQRYASALPARTASADACDIQHVAAPAAAPVHPATSHSRSTAAANMETPPGSVHAGPAEADARSTAAQGPGSSVVGAGGSRAGTSISELRVPPPASPGGAGRGHPSSSPAQAAQAAGSAAPPPPAARSANFQAGPPTASASFRRATSTDQLSSATGARTAALGPPAAALLFNGSGAERADSGFLAGSRAGSGVTSAGGWATPRGGAEPGLGFPVDAGRQGSGGLGSGADGVDGLRGSAAAPASGASATPYKLRCVAHSLGGMSVLIHLVNRLREGRPHHVSRLVLLTPAGFHKYSPRISRPIAWVLPLLARCLRAVLGRNFCFPLYIPTPLGRALTFKMLLSASRIPGLGELLRLVFKALLDGDISQWDRALQMPHYNAEDMPAISLDQVLHLIQLVASDSFRLYDYGSPAANASHYGGPTPPDVASEYWRLDLPVHLVAGRRDGIIPPPNIRRHLDAMRTQGVAVSYREFDFGHLDFTFGVKEELRMYLMKLLRL